MMKKNTFLQVLLVVMFLTGINFNAFADTQGVDAGSDETVCSSTYTLKAFNPFPHTGVWQVISGTCTIKDNTLYNSQITGIPAGTSVTLEWTVDFSGTPSSDQVTITNANPIANAGVDITGTVDNVILSANAPGAGETGTWTTTGGGTFTDKNAFNTNFTNFDAGSHSVKWTIDNGTCTAYDYMYVYFLEANAGIDKTKCDKDISITANYISGVTANWEIISGIGTLKKSAHYSNNGIENIPAGTSVTARWTVSKNEVTVYDEVTVTNASVVANAGVDIATTVDNATLSAIAPGAGETGLWTVNSGGGTVTSENDYNSTITGLTAFGTSQLKWTIDNGTCSDDDLMYIYYYDETVPPTAKIEQGESLNICTDYAFIYGNDPASIGGTPSFSIVSGIATLEPLMGYDHKIIVTDIAVGSVTVRYTVTRGAETATDDIVITNNSLSAVPNAGSDQITASDNVTMSATAPGTGETGTWTVSAPPGYYNITTPNLYNTTITALLFTGYKTATWTVTNGSCSAYDYAKIYRNTTPSGVTATAGNDATTCTGNWTLQGNNPVSTAMGTWTIIDGTCTIDNVNSCNSQISDIPTGTSVTLKWTVTDGTNTKFDEVVITNSAATVTVAQDEITTTQASVSVTGNDPATGTGTWIALSPVDLEFSSENSATTNVSNLSWGDNYVKWQINNGICTNYANITITREVSANAGSDKDICSSSTSLSGNNPGTGATAIWTVVSGSATFANANLYNTTVSGLAEGENELKWSVTYNGTTTVTDNVIIDRGSVTSANAGTDITTTEDNVTLSANNPSDGDGKWSLTTGTGTFSDVNSRNSALTGLSVGTVTATWTITNGSCESSDEVIITIESTITAVAGNDMEICTDETVLSATAPATGNTGTWTVIAGTATFADANLYNTAVTGLSEGINTMKWSVTDGTNTATDEITITNNSVTANAGIDITTEDAEVTLTASNPVSGTGTWTITEGTGTLSDANLYNSVIADLELGTVTATWTVTNGTCESSDEVAIERVELFDMSGSISIPDETTVSGTIELYPIAEKGNEPAYIIEINADGSYSFDGVEKGKYKMLVKLDGYEPTWYGNSTNEEDAFVIDLSEGNLISLDVEVTEEAVGVETLVNSEQLTIYPVPAKNILYIEISNLSSEVSIKIMDIKGQVVINKLENATDSILKLNIQELPKGVYFGKINSAEGNYTIKFIK